MVGLFAKVFKMQDAVIGVISCVSKILASFVYTFSFTVWMFYMGRCNLRSVAFVLY